MWLRKELEKLSYEDLKGIMDKWNYIDVCPPVYWYPGAPEPDKVSRSIKMMNWLLGRPKEFSQALVDEQREYKEHGHQARIGHSRYAKFYRLMVEARSSWQFQQEHMEQAEGENKRKRFDELAPASKSYNAFKVL